MESALSASLQMIQFESEELLILKMQDGSEGPGQAGEMSQQQPHVVQQSPAPEKNKTMH